MEPKSCSLLPRRTINKIALVVFLAVAAFYLWTDHHSHLIGALPFLPYLIFLLCPLMHFFMHRGHGGHGEQKQDGQKPPPAPSTPGGSHAA